MLIVIAGAGVAVWLRLRPPLLLPMRVVSVTRWLATLAAAAGTFLVLDVGGRASTVPSTAAAAGVISVLTAVALRPDLPHPSTTSEISESARS